jgi:hypothetical protein
MVSQLKLAQDTQSTYLRSEDHAKRSTVALISGLYDLHYDIVRFVL